MSRIGKKPILIPSGVEVTLDGSHITVKGPKGTLEHDAPEDITVTREGDELLVSRPDDEREHRALHGLTRSLVANMVIGVSDGFTRELNIVGVGYRAAAQGTASSTCSSASRTPSPSTPPPAWSSRPPCPRRSS